MNENILGIVKELNGQAPRIGKNCFVAETAAIVGNVEMGDDCSIWYSTVLRGDVNFIKIGNRVNIQDGVVIHGTYKKNSTIIGNDVTIGHNASVHGCVIEDKVLIGMGAVVLDGALIKKHSIIAAGAVVLQGTVIDEGCLYAGVPAVKVKELSEDEKKRPQKNAENYLLYKSWYTDR